MIPFEPVLLERGRVRLEPMTRAHVPLLWKAVAAEPRETYALTYVPASEEAMAAYVDEALAAQAKRAAVPLVTVAVAMTRDGTRDGMSDARRVVGSTRFANAEYWPPTPGLPRDRPEGSPDALEIGHTWLVPSAQRSGVNVAAKLLMLGHAFEAWEVHRVHLKTDERNAASRAAILGLGARLDGILRAHMRAADGGPRNTAWYSIVRREWPELRARLERRLQRDDARG